MERKLFKGQASLGHNLNVPRDFGSPLLSSLLSPDLGGIPQWHHLPPQLLPVFAFFFLVA